jgi:hypothetical protein
MRGKSDFSWRHKVNFVRDGVLGPVRSAKEKYGGVQVNHRTLTYRFSREFYDQE